jgi:hypothetical protein
MPSAPAEILSWIVGANVVITLLTTLYTLLSARGTKALTAVGELSKALTAFIDERKLTDAATIARIVLAESRVQSVEAEIKHMPNQKTVHELQLTLKDMAIEMTKIGASADQSARTAGRVEAYLLEHGK